MITTVYFVRHAQPDRGPDSPYTDKTYPLTDKGKSDSHKVTAFFKDKKIQAVISSPYVRAVDTVKGVAKAIRAEIELVDDFRERAITDRWLEIEDFKKFAVRQWEDFDYKLPAGESAREVQERNMKALYQVLEDHGGKNIVIGCHGMSLSTVINFYDKNHTNKQLAEMPMPWICKMTFDGRELKKMENIDILRNMLQKGKKF